ncbi:MAG: glutamate--tRNA ligase [Candidatus Gribaldobacteria bacterium]|nr:glutamate--tRNA ligase [Candidatus Gribaldobacteria bacterium]
MPKEQKLNQEVRVRMAPSPTGPFHIGSARTALFNYLFAKKFQGKFIIRIEDTDRTRSKVEWEESIQEALNWLRLDYDEGLEKGGHFGSYRQSERSEIYQKYTEKLLFSREAYYCFCTPAELEEHRNSQLAQGLAPIYSGKCRKLTKEQSAQKKEAGDQCVIRLKVTPQTVVVNDLLKGQIEYDVALFGDIVIAKSVDEPLYNLACVIDDFEMKITHVIRGEEHLTNTPKQFLIAKALGLDIPQYLHLPLILNQQRAKLSKRDPSVAAKVSDYIEQGYLPEAVVNFIAFLGWNPGDTREIFSLEELIQDFSVEKLQKSGAIFNVPKLDWFNGYYIRQMSLDKLTNLCVPYLVKAGLISPLWGKSEVIPLVYDSNFTVLGFENNKTKEKVSFNQLAKIISLYQERLKKLAEIGELVELFFEEVEYPKEILKWKKMEMAELPAVLDFLLKTLQEVNEKDWNKEKLESVLMPEAERLGDRGKLLWPLRVAVSGKMASAGPFEIAEVLGKEKTLQRIKKAQEVL